MVLGVLLYAVETWPVKQKEVSTLETFHHMLFKNIIRYLVNFVQISQHISN